MKKALILGADGFAGRYLNRELKDNGYQVIASSRRGEYPCDLMNPEQLKQLIVQQKPDVIFHMAAQSSVAKSWKEPALTFDVNVKGTIHLLEVLRQVTWSVRTLIVGSSDQYGKRAENQVTMLDETMPLNPLTPYAISKCTQEALGTLYANTYGLDLLFTRSFNHIGVGQQLGFAIPDFIHEILDVEFGNKRTVRVGNLSAKRDFTDVRDVVRAYRMIVEQGRSGEVYNVGRGEAHSMQEIFDYLCTLSPADIQVELAPEKMRPMDVAVQICDNRKLCKETGWKPTIDLRCSLQDMMDESRKQRKDF